MIQELVENQYGHGGIKDVIDIRDYKWSKIAIGKSVSPYDWTKIYDIEAVLGKIFNAVAYKLPVNNQGTSSSCGGQAWSKYGEVLDLIYNGHFQAKSAKFIYAQTYEPGGGSYGRANCDVVIKKGWGNEADTPSNENGTPPTEQFMERPQDITPVAFTNALQDEALSYAQTGTSIDEVAQAIQENYGCILFVNGQNNGTWLSNTPTPPSSKNPNSIWQHFVFCGGVMAITPTELQGLKDGIITKDDLVKKYSK